MSSGHLQCNTTPRTQHLMAPSKPAPPSICPISPVRNYIFPGAQPKTWEPSLPPFFLIYLTYNISASRLRAVKEVCRLEGQVSFSLCVRKLSMFHLKCAYELARQKKQGAQEGGALGRRDIHKGHKRRQRSCAGEGGISPTGGGWVK